MPLPTVRVCASRTRNRSLLCDDRRSERTDPNQRSRRLVSGQEVTCDAEWRYRLGTYGEVARACCLITLTHSTHAAKRENAVTQLQKVVPRFSEQCTLGALTLSWDSPDTAAVREPDRAASFVCGSSVPYVLSKEASERTNERPTGLVPTPVCVSGTPVVSGTAPRGRVDSCAHISRWLVPASGASITMLLASSRQRQKTKQTCAQAPHTAIRD